MAVSRSQILRQPHRRRREARDSLAAAGEAEPLGRRRLHCDAADINSGDFGDARAHRLAMRADLRRFQRRVEMDDEAAARPDSGRRMRKEDVRRRAFGPRSE